MWEYIKRRVYAIPTPTLQELRNRITDACASVSLAMLYNDLREVLSCVQMYVTAEGHCFERDRQVSFVSGKCDFIQCDQAIVRFVIFLFVSFLCTRCFLVINR